MELTRKSIINISPNTLSACLDSEIVTMDEKTGEYKTYNDTASRIWQIMEEKKSVSFGDLCAILKSEYDVPMETCRKESALFISKMAEENIFTVSNP